MGHPAFFISDIYAILDPANLDLAFAATPVIDEIEALVPGNPTATSSNLAPVKRRKTLNSLVERVAGIEPASQAWKASALPLSYTRPQEKCPAIIPLHSSTSKRRIDETPECPASTQLDRPVAAYCDPFEGSPRYVAKAVAPTG